MTKPCRAHLRVISVEVVVVLLQFLLILTECSMMLLDASLIAKDLQVGAHGPDQTILSMEKLVTHVGGYCQLRMQQGGVVWTGVGGHVTGVKLCW